MCRDEKVKEVKDVAKNLFEELHDESDPVWDVCLVLFPSSWGGGGSYFGIYVESGLSVYCLLILSPVAGRPEGCPPKPILPGGVRGQQSSGATGSGALNWAVRFATGLETCTRSVLRVTDSIAFCFTFPRSAFVMPLRESVP